MDAKKVKLDLLDELIRTMTDTVDEKLLPKKPEPKDKK